MPPAPLYGCDSLIDFVFVIDVSGSVNLVLDDMKLFATRITQSLPQLNAPVIVAGFRRQRYENCHGGSAPQ